MLNSAQLNYRSLVPTSTPATHHDFMSSIKVRFQAFNETDIALAGVNRVNVGTEHMGAGNYATQLNTAAVNNGLMAAQLPGALGTASTNTLNDAAAAPLNWVGVRNAATHDDILATGANAGRKIYGLLQVANTTADNTAAAAVATANAQVSFVCVQADGTLALENVTATVELAFARGRQLYFTAAIEWDGAEPGMSTPPDAIAGGTFAETERLMVATRLVGANDTITISSGAAATAGAGSFTLVAAPQNEAVTLASSAANHLADKSVFLYLNGVLQRKDNTATTGQFQWVSTDSFRLSTPVGTGDVIWLGRRTLS